MPEKKASRATGAKPARLAFFFFAQTVMTTSWTFSRAMIRLYLIVSLAAVVFAVGHAQAQGADGDDATTTERSCDTEAGHALDFWIGEWDLTWTGGQGGTPEGETGRGTNTIKRTLDDCVIEEQFRMSGFDGMSISVFNGRTKDWRQTWVDRQ